MYIWILYTKMCRYTYHMYWIHSIKSMRIIPSQQTLGRIRYSRLNSDTRSQIGGRFKCNSFIELCIPYTSRLGELFRLITNWRNRFQMKWMWSIQRWQNLCPWNSQNGVFVHDPVIHLLSLAMGFSYTLVCLSGWVNVCLSTEVIYIWISLF